MQKHLCNLYSNWKGKYSTISKIPIHIQFRVIIDIVYYNIDLHIRSMVKGFSVTDKITELNIVYI